MVEATNLCCEAVEAAALQMEGIYRKSGVKSRIEALVLALSNQTIEDLSPYNPHVVAGAIKHLLQTNMLTTTVTKYASMPSTSKKE